MAGVAPREAPPRPDAARGEPLRDGPPRQEEDAEAQQRDLEGQRAPRAEARRRAGRANLQQVVEGSFERLSTVWLVSLALMLVGMFGILIWSQAVYVAHRRDPCDQPLALMLRLICIIFIVHVLQRDIVTRCLCYDMARDGPVLPVRVRVFKGFCWLSALAWPVAAVFMLSQSTKCSGQLRLAVEVIVGFYVVLLFVLVIAPGCFVSVVFILVCNGIIRMPRNPAAAPENIIEDLPTVEYRAERFSDSGPPGSHPASCSVCLEAFGAGRPISQTPCGHVYHTDCLGRWLLEARTCPYCRLDLVTGAPPDAEAAAGAGQV